MCVIELIMVNFSDEIQPDPEESCSQLGEWHGQLMRSSKQSC
jgi:hypothetical protein